MSDLLLCAKCSRANPADAAYCYNDGVALGGGNGGAVAGGARAFNSPFVFPTGRTCRTFDELALACQEEWRTACGLLKDGYLESFLGGAGRIDLALAAKEASRFPDTERGLDMLLAKLPSTVLEDPKLRAEPLEVSLGVLDGSQPRTLTVEIENQGMRLLHGTIASDSLWLTLGDGLTNEKHFQFTDEGKIQVNLKPELVRAGKPAEGKLTIESNGGSATVVVRAEKPVKLFPSGALAGAKTPRQIAEKAMKSPKEVAPDFENGNVEKWYADNGWVYPVKVPAASGLAAIQQFFEALGVTKAPKVEINTDRISLSAEPGSSHSLSIEVSTPEKRPVFAHATSNVAWLEVGRARLHGKTATVPMSIPSVPDSPGQTLRGEVTVVSNGTARWVVPVTIEVAGSAPAFGGNSNYSAGGAFDFGSAPENSASAFDFDSTPATPAASPPPPPPPPPPTSPSRSTPVMSIDDDLPAPPPPPSRPKAKRRSKDAINWSAHALPAVFLLVAVSCVVVYDRIYPMITHTGLPQILGIRYDPKALANSRPLIDVRYSRDNRFGLARFDPNNRSARLKLTSDDEGKTNNTRIRVGTGKDVAEYLYGFTTRDRAFRHENDRGPALPRPYLGREVTFRLSNEELDVTQYTQIVPGQGGALDTLLVYYRVENYGKKPQKVAMRIMLDTDIGGNDGAPFLVPGQSKLVTTSAVLEGKRVPEYLEVIENADDAKDPGTVARLGLRNLQWRKDIELTDPSKVVIAGFENKNIGWDWTPKPLGKDSCVAIHWPEVEVKPKQQVNFAFTYGLGTLEVTGDLAMSAPGSVLPGSEFTVTGYVYKARKGQKVTLNIPAGLELVDGADRFVADVAGGRAQVFWKVRAKKEGSYHLHVASDKSKSKDSSVTVKGIF